MGEKLPEETVYIINDQLNRYEPDPDLQQNYLEALAEMDLMGEFKSLGYDETRSKAK